MKDVSDKKLSESDAYEIALDLIFDKNYDVNLAEKAGIKMNKNEIKIESKKGIEGIKEFVGHNLDGAELLNKFDKVINKNLVYKNESIFGINFLEKSEGKLGTYNCVMYADIMFLGLLRMGRVDLLKKGGVDHTFYQKDGHIWPVFIISGKQIDLNSNDRAKKIFNWDALLNSNYFNLEAFRYKNGNNTNLIYKPDFKKGNEGYG